MRSHLYLKGQDLVYIPRFYTQCNTEVLAYRSSLVTLTRTTPDRVLAVVT